MASPPRFLLPAALPWLSSVLHTSSHRLSLTPLKGSTSSSVYLVQRAGDRGLDRFVLRILDDPAWLADEPDLAAHEAAALDEAGRAGLHAPRLVAYAGSEVAGARDAVATGHEDAAAGCSAQNDVATAGLGAPMVVMTFLEGEIVLPRLGTPTAGPATSGQLPADFPGWLAGLARELAAIHRHRAPGFRWRYRSWVPHASLEPPSRPTAALWERAIAWARGPAPAFRPVFIHRDYHPTNVLWRGGAVSGVVDWINACLGPAGVNVAHCRTNLALMYGGEVADDFLAAYEAVAEGFTYDPYWDLDSVLDCSLPEPTFYSPWRDFGLDVIPQNVLTRRIDAYLASVISRL